MLKELDLLSSTEVETLIKAPLLVCILIAGADNEIDKKEVKGAIELAEKGKTKASVAEFYKLVSEDFEDKLKIVFQGLPRSRRVRERRSAGSRHARRRCTLRLRRGPNGRSARHSRG